MDRHRISSLKHLQFPGQLVDADLLILTEATNEDNIPISNDICIHFLIIAAMMNVNFCCATYTYT